MQGLGDDEATGRWRVVLDPRIAQLFGQDETTWLHVAARLSLGKSYLGKWLHAFYSSHRVPHPIRVAALLELSGSETKALYKFRHNLKQALAAVERAETADGRRFEWHIDSEDLVHVRR